MTTPWSRPAADEFAPHFAAMIAAVPEGNILDVLATQLTHVRTLFRSVPEGQGTIRYQPGKWSVKDVLNHVTDCERIYTYRALRIARGDDTSLTGFDPEAYVVAAGADQRALSTLVEEFVSVRQATIALFRSFHREVGLHRGTGSGQPVSVRALAYIAAGHERHHMNVLRDWYGLR